MSDDTGDGETGWLFGGVLLLGVAALVLYGSLLPGVEFPAVAFVLVVVGLFGGVYLVGRSHRGGLA